jgi:hypothetical protein
MLVIHYPTAFRALNSYVDAFNSKAEKNTKRLKAGAVSTAREIIRLYGISLLKANGVSEVDPNNLPSLKTNNNQLAGLVKCSSRSIQRHIVKLQQVGIIQDKVFHGSHSDYEVWVNPQILLVKSRLSVDKINKPLDKEPGHVKQNASESIIFSSRKTNSPHPYTGNKKNNILIDVETVDKVPSLPFNPEKIGGVSAGNIAGDTGEIALKKIEEQKFCEKNFTEKIEKTGEIASRADKSEDRSEVSDPARDNSLKLHVNLFWLMARNLLYKNTDLTENQVKIAKQLIRKFYEPSTEENISNYHSVYTERISLVYKYLQKDSKRFIPLPYIYFDLNNPKGFVGTRTWYKKDQARKKEVEQELALSRMIRKYQNNEKQITAKRKPSLQLFRECESLLGKLGGKALSDRFCAAVIDHEVYRNIQPLENKLLTK